MSCPFQFPCYFWILNSEFLLWLLSLASKICYHEIEQARQSVCEICNLSTSNEELIFSSSNWNNMFWNTIFLSFSLIVEIHTYLNRFVSQALVHSFPQESHLAPFNELLLSRNKPIAMMFKIWMNERTIPGYLQTKIIIRIFISLKPIFLKYVHNFRLSTNCDAERIIYKEIWSVFFIYATESHILNNMVVHMHIFLIMYALTCGFIPYWWDGLYPSSY